MFVQNVMNLLATTNLLLWNSLVSNNTNCKEFSNNTNNNE